MDDHLITLSDSFCSYLNTSYAQTEQVSKIRYVKDRRKIKPRFCSQIKSSDHLFEKLKQAIQAKDVQRVEDLIKDGAPILKGDDKERTPLHIAAATGDAKIVNILLDNGANPNAKDIIGNTPLHLATCTGNIQVITILLSNGINVESLDDGGRSPLMMALSRLKMLRTNNFEFKKSNRLKEETIQILELLRAYQSKSEKDSSQLEDLSDRLDRISAHDEILEIGNIIENLTTLKLSNLNRLRN